MVLIKLPLTAILMTNVRLDPQITACFYTSCSSSFMSGNFCFSLFVGMVMYANEAETKEKYKLPEIKNSLQHTLLLFA